MKYTYHHYLDLVKNKKIKEKKITFEQFNSFYMNMVKYAKKQSLKKRVNINTLLINEKFYYYHIDKYFYNEADIGSMLDTASDIAKFTVDVNIDRAKDKTVKTITSTETGKNLYSKLVGLGVEISNYLKMIKLSAEQVTSEFLKMIFEWYDSTFALVKKAHDIMVGAKDKVVAGIENILLDLVKNVIGEENEKNLKAKMIEKQKAINEYFKENPAKRLIVGCLLSAGICYIWTESASTGNPLMDFNINMYLNLMSTSIEITKVITLASLIEILFYFIINKIKNIAKLLITWFSTSTNLTIVCALLLTAFLIKAIDETEDPTLLKIKKNICEFLGTPPAMATGAAPGKIGSLLKGIGVESKMIDPSSDAGKGCHV